MSSNCQYNAEDEEASGEDDSGRTSQLVNEDSISEQATDLADEVRIRQAILMDEEVPHK